MCMFALFFLFYFDTLDCHPENVLFSLISRNLLLQNNNNSERNPKSVVHIDIFHADSFHISTFLHDYCLSIQFGLLYANRLLLSYAR